MIAAEIAHCGHAVGNQQRQRRSTRLRNVGVHVDQAGHQEAPAAVDDLRVRGRRKRGGRPDVFDAIAAHEDRATARCLVVHRQDRNVADHELREAAAMATSSNRGRQRPSRRTPSSNGQSWSEMAFGSQPMARSCLGRAACRESGAWDERRFYRARLPFTPRRS